MSVERGEEKTASDAAIRDGIVAELLRLEESSRYSAQAQFSQAKIWRATNLWLGVPSAALAAIAGGTGLATTEGRTVIAVLALLAAGLGAIMTTLNAARRAELAHAVANAYLALENDARIIRTIHLYQDELPELRRELGDLAARRSDINATAEIPFRIAYWSAKRSIASGATTFDVDK